MEINFKKVSNIHFIGLGGIGVSALAKLLLSQKKNISGSDSFNSELLHKLSKKCTVLIGHQAKNIPAKCDLIIYSAAIPETNVERMEAKKRKIPQLEYHQALGLISRSYRTIAIAGTHGKSTTTALVAEMFIAAGLDPTVVVGSKVPGMDDNFRQGKSKFLIVEADEFHNGFLHLRPEATILNNLEPDHLDFFKTFTNLKKSFQKYIDQMAPGSLVVYNADDKNLAKLKIKQSLKKITFSQINKADYKFSSKSNFKINNRYFAHNLIGDFNNYNVTAALALARFYKIANYSIDEALTNFKGIWRRFEQVSNNGFNQHVTIISDYAHHPTALAGTIQAAKIKFNQQRVIVVFQPHHYDRTARLKKEFLKALNLADNLILLKIYDVPGRESDGLRSVSSQDLVKILKNTRQFTNLYYASDLDRVEQILKKIIHPQDVILFIGAGTIDGLARKLK